MRDIAVTGATGFVGRRLVAAALGRGWSVTALGRDPRKLSELAHPRLRFVEWTVEAAETTSDIFIGMDAVCHLAAFVPPDFADPRHADACFRINTLGALATVRAAIEADVPRFLHFSSAQTYAPSEGPVDESAPLYPAQRAPFYLSSKVAAEHLVQFHAGRIGTTILRLASVYGPGMKGGVLSHFVENARRGRPLVVADGGRHCVDFVHVDDVAAAAIAAIERDADGIFNIGCGHAASMFELAATAARLSGNGLDSIDVQPIGSGPATAFTALDIMAARTRLGFRPRPIAVGMVSLLRPASESA